MYKVVPPSYTKHWLILLVGLMLACAIMAVVISAEQRIDDLRPTIQTCCLQMTKDWCLECTRFADSTDFQYYKELYEASK
jgi:hypothetical protein